eukprot:SM000102S09195  [mRNA]  locus=s102:184830:188507:- [translate_table: standard]
MPDVPQVDATVDPGLPPDALHAAVREVCRQIVPGWGGAGDANLAVSKVSGGITNIRGVSRRGARRESGGGGDGGGGGGDGGRRWPVTVRVFGPNTDAVIDRKRELEALKVLTDAGFGAELLGVFKNGLVQGYLDARTLEPADMASPDMVPLIARAVRRFHGTDVPGDRSPKLWPTIFTYLHTAMTVGVEDGPKRRRLADVSFKELTTEIERLKVSVPTSPPPDSSPPSSPLPPDHGKLSGQVATDCLCAPVVFAHNDLLSGNFMYEVKSGALHIIDFEYGSYSFRGYDIGNHFNEYAGLDCDYSRYPEKDAQYLFFRSYLSPDNPEEAPATELDRLYVETNCYALVSHLYWAVWALVQANYSPIDFDYIEYFFLRYGEYWRRRDDFLALASEHASVGSLTAT